MKSILEVLQEQLPQDSAIVCTVTMENMVARLDMSAPAFSSRSATITTPGEGWFALTLDGGYVILAFADEPSEEELEEIVKDRISLGERYLRDGAQERLEGLFRLPVRVIVPGRPDSAARLPAGQEARFFFARLRRPKRGEGE